MSRCISLPLIAFTCALAVIWGTPVFDPAAQFAISMTGDELQKTESGADTYTHASQTGDYRMSAGPEMVRSRQGGFEPEQNERGVDNTKWNKNLSDIHEFDNVSWGSTKSLATRFESDHFGQNHSLQAPASCRKRLSSSSYGALKMSDFYEQYRDSLGNKGPHSNGSFQETFDWKQFLNDEETDWLPDLPLPPSSPSLHNPRCESASQRPESDMGHLGTAGYHTEKKARFDQFNFVLSAHSNSVNGMSDSSVCDSVPPGTPKRSKSGKQGSIQARQAKHLRKIADSTKPVTPQDCAGSLNHIKTPAQPSEKDEYLREEIQTHDKITHLEQLQPEQEAAQWTGNNAQPIYAYIASISGFVNLSLRGNMFTKWDSFLEEFTKAQLFNNIGALAGFEEEALRYKILMMRKLEFLYKRIWCLNLRFIERIQPKCSETLIEGEQFSLQDWLLKQISYQPSDCLSAAGSAITEPMDCEVPHPSQLRNLIFTCLAVQDETVLWLVPDSNTSVETSEITKSKLSINQAAVSVIGSYYKSTNPPKWRALFKEDWHFLRVLVIIRLRMQQVNYHKEKNSKCTKQRLTSPFPWNQAWLLNDQWHFDGRAQRAFRKSNTELVRGRIFDLKHLDASFEHSTPKDSLMVSLNIGKPKKKVFHWIGLMLDQLKNKFSQVSQNPFEIIYSEIKENSLFTAAASRLRLKHGRIKADNLLQPELKNFLERVWCLNGEFLKVFSAKPLILLHEQEQRALQKWVSEDLFGQDMEEGAGGFSPKEDKVNCDQIVQLKEVILSTFYLSPENKLNSSQDLQRLVDDVEHQAEVTKAVVLVVAFYYKNLNIKKWKYFFDVDESYLTMLVLIANRCMQKNIKNMKKSRIIMNLKEIQVIPWSKPLTRDIQDHLSSIIKFKNSFNKPVTNFMRLRKDDFPLKYYLKRAGIDGS